MYCEWKWVNVLLLKSIINWRAELQNDSTKETIGFCEWTKTLVGIVGVVFFSQNLSKNNHKRDQSKMFMTLPSTDVLFISNKSSLSTFKNFWLGKSEEKRHTDTRIDHWNFTNFTANRHRWNGKIWTDSLATNYIWIECVCVCALEWEMVEFFDKVKNHCKILHNTSMISFAVLNAGQLLDLCALVYFMFFSFRSLIIRWLKQQH